MAADLSHATRCNAWLLAALSPAAARREGTAAMAAVRSGGTDAPAAVSRRWRGAGARRPIVATLLLLAGAGLATQAGWVHAKALLAQHLLQSAWTRTLASGSPHAPWPWADTAPVARLQVPGHGIDQIVLRGDSGRTLAFGPGWAEASATPGRHGTVVVSGHRDTHFGFLRDLAVGDAIALQGTDGAASYRVVETRVADSRSERLALGAEDDTLWLVTCWPFDAVTAGGPLRYAVRAVRTEAIGAQQPADAPLFLLPAGEGAEGG